MTHHPSALAAAVLLSACSLDSSGAGGLERVGPELHDERLTLTLMASDPEVATPIGIAVDRQDRVYLLESHTHLTPAEYAGPPRDRIKVFVDVDQDGSADSVRVFAEGIEDGMNLAFSPSGDLYVVASRAVIVLRDGDADGASESRDTVLSLIRPGQVYDHSALLGITFSPDGWLYLARGNTGGAHWELRGSDGSSASGYGDGGSILRSRPDGSGLEPVATGFWNPFDLKFDATGRLLAVDNDPDSRGPNRLVHVVPGGDYGYRSLYGGSGIHPYLAWNGELPGTLPYAAALGEAPSGLIDAGATALPDDYRGSVLATIWEESRVVRVDLEPRGASVAGTARTVIEGGPEFRPVAMAADSRGNVYLTDWVVREYPSHGRGRLWRLSPRRPASASRPAPAEIARRSGSPTEPGGMARLREALRSPDPFVRHAAEMALSRPPLRDSAVAATRDEDPRIRLGGLLALRRAGHPDATAIARRLLGDPDPRLRRMALIWTGDAGLLELRPELERAIGVDPVTPELFETYLATVEQLTPAFVAGYRRRAEQQARKLPRALPDGFVRALVADSSRAGELRARAVAYLPDPPAEVALLSRIAGDGRYPALRSEAVRSLAAVADSGAAAILLRIATSAAEPAALRADAILALTSQPGDPSAGIRELLRDPSPEVRLEAARYLRTRAPETAVRLAAKVPDPTAAEQLLHPASSGRPTTPAAWARIAGADGDPARGRRVFHSTSAMCSQCHTAERRGGDLGPDLTHVGRSKSRRQIVTAILDPSAEISPEWQGWFVRTADGTTHRGRQIDIGEGSIDLYVPPGRFITLRDAVEHGTLPGSLMPKGLEAGLTRADFRDLVAYLAQPR